MHKLEDRLKSARELSWKHQGKKITFFLPGMFKLNGHTGKYPAVSITGEECALKCDHCQGKILSGMVQGPDPQKLIEKCQGLAKKGHLGVLLSGGCKDDGSMPWEDFLPAIETIKETTDLFVSVHCGLVDPFMARQLKTAGADQALIDVIGDDQTFQKIYHVPFGVERIESAMQALSDAKIPLVPHIVCGLDYGQIKGEFKAVEMISSFEIAQLVIVALMRIPGTPAASGIAPSAEQVADVLIDARLKMPRVPISLGCARQRGNSKLEELAIDAGINKMALPSEEAIERAKGLGMEISYQPTCCSVSSTFLTDNWHESTK